jgi:peptidoglycan-associated lipoprotein
MRSAISTFAALAIVIALGGCAGSSWQFWKTSTETPAEPAVATATPAAAPATAPAPTVTPAPAAEPAAVAASSSNGFAPLPALADVRFRSGQVAVNKADARVLENAVRWLKANPGSQVMIEGHTDDLGSREENLAVGEKRATSVARYLISKGLEPTRISAVSVGSDRPVCLEKTDACRAKNRRASFLVKQH